MENVVIQLTEQQSDAFHTAFAHLPSTISVKQWLEDSRLQIQQEVLSILSPEQIDSLKLLQDPNFRGVLHLQNIPQPDIIPPTPKSGSREDDAEYLPEYVIAAIATAGEMSIKPQKAFDITPNDRFGRNDDPSRPIPSNNFHFDGQNGSFVFLSCKRGNPEAHTDFVDVKVLLEGFSQEEIRSLKTRALFTGEYGEDRKAPILVETEKKGLAFRDYIDFDNVRGVSTEAEAVLQKLKERMPEYTLSVTLKAGEAVVFNNAFENGIMHGQTKPYLRNPDMAQTRWITRQYADTLIPPELQNTTNAAMQSSKSFIARIAALAGFGKFLNRE
jgi:hypothetical protein